MKVTSSSGEYVKSSIVPNIVFCENAFSLYWQFLCNPFGVLKVSWGSLLQSSRGLVKGPEIKTQEGNWVKQIYQQRIVIQHIQNRGLWANVFRTDYQGCQLEYCLPPKSTTCCYLTLEESMPLWVNYHNDIYIYIYMCVCVCICICECVCVCLWPPAAI